MTSLQLQVAAATLRRGGVVMHATEGVWGLACDPFDAVPVRRVLALKGRSESRGLIVIGSSEEDFAPELGQLDESLRARVLATWPGAITWIVANVRFPPWITGAHRSVAIRVPGHGQARALCAAFGGPLVSTSANPSGRPPATTALAARRYFQASVDYVLPGETAGRGRASRIEDARSGASVRR